MINYELSTRYSLGLNESYDFGDQEKVTNSMSVIRRFDRFYVALTLTADDESNDTGVFFSIRPNYVQDGLSTSRLAGVMSD